MLFMTSDRNHPENLFKLKKQKLKIKKLKIKKRNTLAVKKKKTQCKKKNQRKRNAKMQNFRFWGKRIGKQQATHEVLRFHDDVHW